MNSAQTDFLISIIKEKLSSFQKSEYTDALHQLNEKFNLVTSENYASPDDFVVECIENFYEGNVEFSDERYRGLNLEDIMSSVNDFARDFKITLCDILKKNPDQDFVNSTGEIWKDTIKLILAKLIEEQTGIPNEMNTIMFSAMVVYCISHTITNICD